MKVLLDTQIFLWWITDDPKLSQKDRKIISASDNEIYISPASAWEIEIKAGLGKIELPKNAERYLAEQIFINSFQVLPIQFTHAMRVLNLPPHHRDPFDRLLVSQAQAEEMFLMSTDPLLRRYDVRIL